MFVSNNKKLKDITIVAGLFTMGLLPLSALGLPHGSAIPVGGTYTFEARMNNQLLRNEAGAETVFNFNIGNWPNYEVYCQSYMKPGGIGDSGPDSGMTFDLMSTIPLSMENPGYLYLNEYFDVKVEIEIGGNVARKVAVPVKDIWNGGSDPIECTPPKVNSRDYGTELRTGSNGSVTFRLKKPIINGVLINQAELVQVFAKKGSPANALTSYAAIPSTRVVLGAGIITVADKCVVNEGNPINIDFHDVANTSDRLNGINYAQPFKIPVKCTGGSFTTGDLNIKLSLLPGPSGSADFNPNYFGTLRHGVKRSNLGIVVTDNLTGSVIRPNQAYPFLNFVHNQGIWNLTAAPIAAPGSTVQEGEFTGTGTILAEFQ